VVPGFLLLIARTVDLGAELGFGLPAPGGLSESGERGGERTPVLRLRSSKQGAELGALVGVESQAQRLVDHRELIGAPRSDEGR
jgi:hypothetical protein